MITQHIAPILYVTGVITALPVLQFLFPRPALQALSKVRIDDEAGLFFARHWGLCTLTVGLLLVWAGGHPAGREAIVAAITVEKVGLVALVLSAWNRLPGLRGAGLFDACASILYVAYLLGA